MRILVVSQYFWPESFQINDLVSELSSRGYDITVLTGLPNYPDGEIFPDYLVEPDLYNHFEGVELVRVPMVPRGKGGLRLMLNYLTFALSACILGPWKLRKLKFDAIFVYEPSPVTVGLPALLMRYLKRAPMIFWVQDLWPETLKAVGVIKSKFGLWAVGRLVSFIYKRCDLILAQSKSFIAQIRDYAPPASNILYFPNWSDTVFVTDVLPAEEVPVQYGCFNVMFAGNIGEAQDLPAVLAAADHLKMMPNLRWLIVGDGRMATWVADEVKRRGLQEQVLLLGRFPSKRMPSFFKHADALLVCLKDEPIFAMTIPSKLQTYLAAGVPVLCMLNGEGSDIVSESGSGLTCKAGDHLALADAVFKLTQMTAEERNEMGQNGLAVSSREFGRTQLIDRLQALLAEAVATYQAKPKRDQT